MRIAHFVQRYPPALGGSEVYFAWLSRYLASRGHSVTVFTTTALDLEAFWSRRGRTLPAGVQRDEGVCVRRYPLVRWPGRRYFLKPLSLLPARSWQCLTFPCNPIAPGMWADAGRDDSEFDVVHATAFPYAWPVACALRLARRRRIPFLLTPFLHLGDSDDPRDPERRQYTHPALLWLIRAADRTFVQTQIERAALLSHGIPEQALILQGMGIDPAECTGGSRRRARACWGAVEDEPVVGHLANNSREKGTIDLLLAADRLWRRGCRFRLVLAGPHMPNFLKFWTAHVPRGPVIRLGVLSDAERRDFFAGIDLFALPSRSDSFGLVLLEAWANAVPNVAYRAGGPAEVIRNEEDGLLVRSGDVEALCLALERLIESPPLRQQLGNAGQRTSDDFRLAAKLEQVLDVCEMLTGEGKTCSLPRQ